MKRICCLAIFVVFLGHASTKAQAPKWEKFQQSLILGDNSSGDLSQDHFLFSPETFRDPADKRIRLVRSVLLSHGPGNTDHHQGEPLTAKAWAKVVYHLETAPTEDAELLFFGAAEEVVVNGVSLGKSGKVPSTGWSRVRVPATALKPGVNAFVFQKGGSLLVEPGRGGNSFKSVDGGKTWTTDNLTDRGDVAGDYLTRFRLTQHPLRGVVQTRPIDLWYLGAPGNPRKVDTLTLGDFPGQQPAGTAVKVWARLSKNRSGTEASWTEWLPMDKDLKLDAGLTEHRYVQLKFELATKDPSKTPRLPDAFTLNWKGLTQSPLPGGKLGFAFEPSPETLIPGSLPFVYQKPSAKLEHLRKRHKLDEVIAPGKTEMEQFMLLRWWVRNQWHTAWGNHNAGWMPPWDAVIILECKDQPECLTMCTHYAAVFTQCCQALGWNARHCILDHHCVAEVYSFEHDKWIMMDAGNSAQRADVGLHFERRGVPLSARELHLAWRASGHKPDEINDITVHFTPARLVDQIKHLCREAPKGKADTARPDVIPVAKLKDFPVCGMENYRRYAFPPRNNFLSTLHPGELYQGWAEYFYDGYCWVGDSPDRPTTSPEYSRLLDPRRPQDADWNLGGTRIHLAQGKALNEWHMELESLMPNVLRLERKNSRQGKETWEPVAASFVWTLAPGENTLVVRSVNHWGKAGKPSKVTVTWTK